MEIERIRRGRDGDGYLAAFVLGREQKRRKRADGVGGDERGRKARIRVISRRGEGCRGCGTAGGSQKEENPYLCYLEKGGQHGNTLIPSTDLGNYYRFSG